MFMKAVPTLLILLGAADAPTGSAAQEHELTATVVTLAHDMARNASQLAPERNAHLIPETDKVVYVSNGYPIRGKDYLSTLGDSYSKRKSLTHTWEKWEVTAIPPNGAVFTGWGTISEESLSGEKKTERVIFTMVFAKTDAGWKRVIAQKSRLDEE